MAFTTGLPTLRGPLLVALISSVCSAGFLLFGYDQGVMSGVTISAFWLEAMGQPSQLMVGTITALYDVGAFFGALAAAFTTEPLGRKRTLLLGTGVLVVGSILQGVAQERIMFMVGRVVTGIGIGYICSVTPVYQAEISKTAQRGWQVACMLTTMLVGLMLAYWINYGLYFHRSDVQWRFPLLFQLVFAAYILAVTVWLPDSPRWLLRHSQDSSQGLDVLARLRGRPVTDPAVLQEYDEIMCSLKMEVAEEGSWADLFRSNGVRANKRFYLAVGIQWMQQMTGINIVTYYAPTIFKSPNGLGLPEEEALFLGCWTQVWYVFASFLTWYMIDRVGRRKLFISCAIGCCLSLVAEAVCVAVEGRGASIAGVCFVWLFEAFFTWGWMTTVWIYPAEILPLKIRAKGASIAAAADFLGNFLVVEVTPIGIQNIGWKFYIVWAVVNLVQAAVVFVLYPETGGLPLEAVDLVFVEEDNKPQYEGRTVFDIDNVDEFAQDGRGYRRLQWGIVGRSNAAVKAARRKGYGDDASRVS